MPSRRLGTTLLPHFDDEVEETSSRMVLLVMLMMLHSIIYCNIRSLGSERLNNNFASYFIFYIGTTGSSMCGGVVNE